MARAREDRIELRQLEAAQWMLSRTLSVADREGDSRRLCDEIPFARFALVTERCHGGPFLNVSLAGL